MQTLKIDEVTLTPNPVIAGRQILISVSVSKIPEAIVTADNTFIMTDDGAYLLAKNTEHAISALLDDAGNVVQTGSGSALEFL